MNERRRLELFRKVGILGLRDLRKLAPIGDIGYVNGFTKGCIESAILTAFREQMGIYPFHVVEKTAGRTTDRTYTCQELGLTWHIDSSD